MTTHEHEASQRDRSDLLDKTEARAALGGISRPTLDRLRRRGELGFVRVGGRVFFEAEEIERYIASQRVPAKAAAS